MDKSMEHEIFHTALHFLGLGRATLLVINRYCRIVLRNFRTLMHSAHVSENACQVRG